VQNEVRLDSIEFSLYGQLDSILRLFSSIRRLVNQLRLNFAIILKVLQVCRLRFLKVDFAWLFDYSTLYALSPFDKKCVSVLLIPDSI